MFGENLLRGGVKRFFPILNHAIYVNNHWMSDSPKNCIFMGSGHFFLTWTIFFKASLRKLRKMKQVCIIILNEHVYMCWMHNWTTGPLYHYCLLDNLKENYNGACHHTLHRLTKHVLVDCVLLQLSWNLKVKVVKITRCQNDVYHTYLLVLTGPYPY